MEIPLNSVTIDITMKRNPNEKTIALEQEKKELVQQKQQEWLENTKKAPLDLDSFTTGVEQVNKLLSVHNTRLEFSVHEKTKGIIVKVVNDQTGELIREVPPERVLNMVAMIWEQIGLLVDEKA